MRKNMPGPAHYTLPPTVGCLNADITKIKNPCYTIGNRQEIKYESFGPGPAIYHPGACTRYGVDKKSVYVGTRLEDLKTFETPAPNTYNLPKTAAYQRRAPAYEFGVRTKQFAGQQIPAPNAYNLPATIGAKGTVIGCRTAPSYTMGNVATTLTKFVTPSPAEYFPTLNNVHKIQPTIKARIEDLKTFESPAPNTYNLQMHKPGARSPAYSIRNRIEDWGQFGGRVERWVGSEVVRITDFHQKHKILVEMTSLQLGCSRNFKI